MKTVLVPLDGSTAATALPVARVLAELEGASLRILHVGQPFLPPRDLLDRLGLTPEDVQGLVLDQATGPPAESIVRLARHWRSVLIVLCTHTRREEPEGQARLPSRCCSTRPARSCLSTRSGDGGVGGAANRSAARWHADHGRCAWTRDGAGAAAPNWTCCTSRRQTRRPSPTPSRRPNTWTSPSTSGPVEREFLEQTLGLSERPPSVRTRAVLRRGAPEPILRFAREREGDLIVLAWHGRLEPGRARIMRQILRETPCPILALRAEEHAGHGGGTAATWPRERSLVLGTNAA